MVGTRATLREVHGVPDRAYGGIHSHGIRYGLSACFPELETILSDQAASSFITREKRS